MHTAAEIVHERMYPNFSRCSFQEMNEEIWLACGCKVCDTLPPPFRYWIFSCGLVEAHGSWRAGYYYNNNNNERMLFTEYHANCIDVSHYAIVTVRQASDCGTTNVDGEWQTAVHSPLLRALLFRLIPLQERPRTIANHPDIAAVLHWRHAFVTCCILL